MEVETPSRSYSTQLIASNDTKDASLVANAKDGFLLKRQIYTLKVPQVITISNYQLDYLSLALAFFFIPVVFQERGYICLLLDLSRLPEVLFSPLKSVGHRNYCIKMVNFP